MTENLHSYVCTAESCYYWRHYKMSKKETWWEEARRLTYLMILQRFVSHCYHCFLEWKERGAGHMRIEEEVEEGPIWEKPTRKCPSPYQVVLWSLHSEGHTGRPRLKHYRARNIKHCNKQLPISHHCLWSTMTHIYVERLFANNTSFLCHLPVSVTTNFPLIQLKYYFSLSAKVR